MYADLIAGCIAGSSGVVVGHPLDTLKTRLQCSCNYRGFADCLRQSLKTENALGLYRGMFAPLASAGLLHALLFAGYGATLKLLHRNDANTFDSRNELPIGEVMLASAVGATLQLIPAIPVEVLKTNLQVVNSLPQVTLTTSGTAVISYTGPVNCARSLIATNGVSSLYKPMMIVLAALACLSLASALDNGLVRTPPMGWMSWTKFYCEVDCERHPFGCINEQLYKDMADRMAEDGYREAGYEYVHIDDCWMAYNRTEDGKLVANKTRFPSGIPALADYVHNLGLKFAIYEDIGTKTCGGYPGSAGHLKQDAQTFADWNVDYLKLDGCYIEEDDMPKVYPEMSKYLLSSGRPIVYSCSWPAYLIQKPDKVNYSVIAKYCNLWRNFDDISRSWQSILSIVDWYTANQDKLIPANGPGQWNDPDMIIVGNTEITPDQGRVQMSLWSIWSAPLIMSNDLRTIDPESLEILLNRRVIAIDQDPLGIMGRMVLNISTVSIYVKPVTPVDTAQKLYSYAVAIFNRGTQPVEVEFKLTDIGLKYSGGYDLQDLWSGKKLGRFRRTDKYKAKLRATSVDFFKATLGGLERKIPKFEIEQDSV